MDELRELMIENKRLRDRIEELQNKCATLKASLEIIESMMEARLCEKK